MVSHPKVVYHTLGTCHVTWVYVNVIHHVINIPQKCDIDEDGTWLYKAVK